MSGCSVRPSTVWRPLGAVMPAGADPAGAAGVAVVDEDDVAALATVAPATAAAATAAAVVSLDRMLDTEDLLLGDGGPHARGIASKPVPRTLRAPSECSDPR